MPRPVWDFLPHHQRPSVGNIAWCRFPYAGQIPAPKSRPVLIRAVQLSEAHDEIWVTASYGSSKISKRGPFDLLITNATEMHRMGLYQNTRFDLFKCIDLPWAREFFAPPGNSASPVIGHITEAAKIQLRTILRIRDELEAAGALRS